VYSKLGRYRDVLLESLHAQRFIQLLQARQTKTKTAQKRRHNFADRTGIINKEPGRPYPSHLKVVELDRLPKCEIYPPFDHHILERPYEVLPPPPKLHDRTCAYSDKYYLLDETKLQYTVEQGESVVILDRKTGEIVAIVIRGFVKSYYDSVEPWCSNLVVEALNCHCLTLRNNPGMVQVGVSTGSRQAPLFGWVRNLYDKYKKANDCQTHEQQLSSLFGFFYSLVQGQLLIAVAKFEEILVKHGFPRYDKYDAQQFTLPFENGPTFQCRHLAPPEGYVTHNVTREIHRDGHWTGCNIGAYWNIRHRQVAGIIGKESGGSFFVSDYGVRVVNATNSCVEWNISLNHGTGILENGLEQIIITMLLSRM
jgi:hypothetical protein